MADSLKIEFNGALEFKEMLDGMRNDFGVEDTRRILVQAVRKSMQPVLATSKALVRKDTGALEASLRIEARKPTTKDKRSVYVHPNDTVIATVTTAPPKVLAKKAFHNLKNKKSKIKQVGIESDMRAIANEFGTGKMAAKPFLRPAMESNSEIVVNSLFSSLITQLEKYKSRYNK